MGLSGGLVIAAVLEPATVDDGLGPLPPQTQDGHPVDIAKVEQTVRDFAARCEVKAV